MKQKRVWLNCKDRNHFASVMIVPPRRFPLKNLGEGKMLYILIGYTGDFEPWVAPAVPVSFQNSSA